MLSFMLLDGTDVRSSPAQAYVWASMALEQGQAQSQEIRDAAVFRLDRKEIEAADQVLAQCLALGTKACVPSLADLD